MLLPEAGSDRAGVIRFLIRQSWPFIALLCYVSGASSKVAASSARTVEIPIERVYRWRSNGTSAAVELAQGSTFDKVENFFDLQYTGSVEIGSPARSLRVCLDTGSSDLWFDGLVDTFSSTRRCPPKGCKQSTEIQYSKGDVKGVIRVDNVSFGESASFDQQFVLAETITGLTARNFDGVLGLAFDKLSHTGTTVMHQLSGVADSFSFYLTDEGEQSWFVLGSPRSEWSEGDFTYSGVVVKAWWTFEAAWVVGNTLLIEKSCFALDTGTSYLTVPKVDYPTMIDYVLPKSLREDPEYDCEFSANNLWTCLCSVRKLMDISCVMLNGKAFPIFPEDIMRPNILGSECTLQIQQSGNNLPWILGDTFLRTIVPIFDMKNSRIGMALRKTHKPSLRESEEKLARSNDIVWGKPVLKPFYPGDNFDWKMLWWAVPLVLCGGVAVGLLLGTIIAKAMDLCCPPKRRIVTPAQTAQRQTAPAAAPQGRAAAAAEGRESQAPYVQLA